MKVDIVSHDHTVDCAEGNGLFLPSEDNSDTCPGGVDKVEKLVANAVLDMLTPFEPMLFQLEKETSSQVSNSLISVRQLHDGFACCPGPPR